ncbi:hypothetical protein PP655_gp094 [Bacillus phage PBC4]|uniref:Uncharacterized protein n=1 Tax=Bacillus phage PBC4 TaxID=1675028 RepID=A0A1D6X8E7_9CAUD|nr:hypothetical protein PP655_gp094 [Bacillus phage PBC4]AKQ08286.1 hypothetical protein PBC4_094 [Bacillus phage PBC4]WEM05649.1 hypothetical protein BSG01_010 [Bacillus phage BSG01]
MKVKFICKYEDVVCGLKAYEFETPDYIHIDIHDYSSDKFRLDILNGKPMIMELISDDEFLVSEDVTHLFNLNDILEQMKEIESEIPSEQGAYTNWLLDNQ